MGPSLSLFSVILHQELHHQGLLGPSDGLPRWRHCQISLPSHSLLPATMWAGMPPSTLQPLPGSHSSTHSSLLVSRRQSFPPDTSRQSFPPDTSPVMVTASCSCLTLGTSASLVDFQNPTLCSISLPSSNHPRGILFPSRALAGKDMQWKGC